MARKYKFIVSGGGTGGHIYPAVAIADALRASYPDCEILFVGAAGKMETEKVPKAGYELVVLPMRGLQRSLAISNLALPFRMIYSLGKAIKIVKKFRPDAVIGTGGYASAAALAAAQMTGVPTLVQEQNAYPGLINKLFGQRAVKVCTAYPDVAEFFPEDRVILTGNPVRSDIASSADLRKKAPEFFGLKPGKVLLVIGGSLGAKTLNDSILAGYKTILEAGYQLIWQTGKGYFTTIKKEVGEAPAGMYFNDFIYEMKHAYAAADLVIARAGALSVSELCLAEKATILVPSPYVAEDHQTKNARALTDKNAAVLVTDAEAREKLVPAALALLADDEKRSELSRLIAGFAAPAAAERIAKEVINICRKS